MSHEADNPTLTVVVVSDHAGDEEKAWADLRETLEGLAAQEYAGQTATLYVESPDRIARIPREMKQILPALEIVEGPVSNSYSLKTAGMEAATTAAVAFLDADCVPAAGWLRAAASMTNKYPDAAVVVGKTEYGSARLSYRILSMLSRSTEDPGHDGETEHISANNAVYRRAAYLQSPLPANVAFFSRTHAVAVRKAGGKIYFDRAMHVHHKFAGWRHEADFRRRLGHGVIAMRQAYPDMPKSWLKRLGYGLDSAVRRSPGPHRLAQLPALRIRLRSAPPRATAGVPHRRGGRVHGSTGYGARVRWPTRWQDRLPLTHHGRVDGDRRVCSPPERRIRLSPIGQHAHYEKAHKEAPMQLDRLEIRERRFRLPAANR